MNRIDRLFGNRGRIKSSWDSVFLKNLGTDTGEDISKYAYKKSDLVFVCISTTARAISQVPLKVMQKTSTGWEGAGVTHPIQQLLSKPNPMTNSIEELISSLVSYLLLDGHVFLVPFPPNQKTVDSLWVVRREFMDIMVDQDTNQIIFWVYKPSKGVTLPLYPNEVGSIKFFNPYDQVWGFPPLEAGKLPLVNDYKAASYTSQFWDQGAVPGGVLETEKHLTEDRVDRIRKQFLSEHEGYKKAHKVAVLEGGLKYQQIGLSQKDMEFIDLRKYNRDNILQIFGMKKAVISVTEDLNYATAKEERKEWWQDTNIPLMKMVEASLTNIMFPGSLKEKVIFDISTVEALHDDYTKRVEIGEILWRMGFTATEINERLELGFQPRKWRNNWYMPVNMVPMTDTGPEPVQMYPSYPPAPPAASVSPDKLLETPPLQQIEADEVFEVKSLEQDSEDKVFQLAWKSLIEKTEPLEAEFLSKMRRCFFDMRKKTLSLLNQKSVNDVLNEQYLSEKSDLVKWTVPIYEKSARVGANALSGETGINVGFNINDPENLHFLTSRPLKVRHVVDTVKNQIAKDINEGMKVNETTNQIAGRIKNTFNRSQQRAMTIARTEVGSSVSYGRSKTMKGMARHGFTKKIWVTAGDEAVRHTHQKMNGVKQDIEKNWVVGGSTLRFPGDPNGAGQEVINCRCIEVVDESSRTAPAAVAPSAPEPLVDETIVSRLREAVESNSSNAYFSVLAESFGEIPTKGYKGMVGSWVTGSNNKGGASLQVLLNEAQGTNNLILDAIRGKDVGKIARDQFKFLTQANLEDHKGKVLDLLKHVKAVSKEFYKDKLPKTLFRGISGEPAQALKAVLATQGEAEVELASISSFSSKRDIARMFSLAEDEPGLIFRMDLGDHLDNLFFSHETNPYLGQDEYEYLMTGGKYLAKKNKGLVDLKFISNKVKGLAEGFREEDGVIYTPEGLIFIDDEKNADWLHNSREE